MQQSDSLLRVEGLHVAYRPAHLPPVHAVRGASFEISPGEVVALVGESGSGKSSIASALLGLLPPAAVISAGRILLRGQDVTAAPEGAWRRIRGRDVGLVPQEPGLSLDPIRRIRHQVTEAMAVHGTAATIARARVPSILAEMGLTDTARIAASFPHELSGGMRQRVLMGIGLANHPPLLVSDEPTSGLDVSVQRQVMDHLTGLVARQSIAVLLITHDLGMAADRADRILVMRDGQIVEAGSTAAVFAAPRHAYTRSLLAARLRNGAPRHCVAASGPPIAVVEGLAKSFGGRPAVTGISFTIPRHGTTSIVGESGSGKSTTARILLGLDIPSAGRVLFDGQDIANLSRKGLRDFRRRVQVVYQNPYASLDPRQTVEEIIAEPLRAFGIGDRTARRERVATLLYSVGLADRLRGVRPASLSGGQRQRVAIARALAVGPELVVLDEPVSALDASVQAQVLALLRKLQDETGISYLLISHDLAVVRDVSDHVVVMRHGRVVEQGPTAAIFGAPSNPYTRALLDDAPGQIFLRQAEWKVSS